VKPTPKSPETETSRLNKVVAHRSKYSRREAEKVIVEGKVQVNGKTVTYLNGKPLKKPDDKYTVIVYNKPRGELVTKKDPRGRRTVYDSLPSGFSHFMPVGRLDFASEGVLLMTDSSTVADLLMTSGMERVYNLKISGPVTPEMEQAMMEGITLDDATAGGHEKSGIRSMTFAPFIAWSVEKSGGRSKLKVVINEGKNRELRRFFAHFNAEVLDLKRVSFGGIELNALPTGKFRYLSKKEYDGLHDFIRQQKKEKKGDHGNVNR